MSEKGFRMPAFESSQPSNTPSHSAQTFLQYAQWTIVPKKENLLILGRGYRDVDPLVEPVGGARWFRRTDVLRILRKLPDDHGLEGVTLMLADDAEDYAAYSLLSDLTKLAVRADFTLMSLIVPSVSTDQLVASLQLTSSTH
jgi:hypothetical protein